MGNVEVSNHKLPDGSKKSFRNATKICHSIFLGVKAVLLSIRFEVISPNVAKKHHADSKYTAVDQLQDACVRERRLTQDSCAFRKDTFQNPALLQLSHIAT